jgi:hypothetical protein
MEVRIEFADFLFLLSGKASAERMKGEEILIID